MSAIEAAFDEHDRVVSRARGQLARVRELATIIAEAFRGGHKLLTCGNGGSAADAQHIAAEFVGRFARERAPLPAIALTTDSSAITALANDYGYEIVFARQVSALARPGDVLLAISTSGRSPNVIAAARSALEVGCKVGALTGASGGPLAELASVSIVVPSDDVARVQEVHELCLHAIAQEVENHLFPEAKSSP
jgi:D-sedoheptulose 7-phosphate isomerase